MGHSQGGQATATAAADSRILYVIDFNAVDMSIPKPYLAVSGTDDITGFTASGMSSAIDGASLPAAYLYYLDPVGSSTDLIKGHLVLMLTPGRVTSQTVAWWQMWFRNDAPSAADFIGPNCGFCNQGSSTTNPYDYGANSLLGSDAGAPSTTDEEGGAPDASGAADAGGAPDASGTADAGGAADATSP